MRLVHTTLLANLESIRGSALKLSFAKDTNRPAVWLHLRSKNAWAEAHVRVRHQAEDLHIVHIDVEVPMGDLRKHSDGLYYVLADVPVPQDARAVMIVRSEQRV